MGRSRALERVRADLRWLASARPLCAPASWRTRDRHAAPAPRAQEGEEGALRRLAEAPPRRLGRYFERLHRLALAAPEIELLAENRVIVDGKRTAGELDVLYRHGGEVVHREVAVKLYVGLGDSVEHRDWIGPDRVDRLDLKLTRLADKQLTLPSRAIAGGYWPGDLPRPTRSEVLLLGALFRHPSASALPRGVDPGVTLGFWCEASELEPRFAQVERWAVLPKPWWLSREQARFEPAQTAREVLGELDQRGSPLLIGARADGEPRGFVVPDGWFRHDPAG